MNEIDNKETTTLTKSSSRGGIEPLGFSISIGQWEGWLQLGSVQAKLATKTEALLRVGADLEESSQEGRKLSAQCNNFERNLRRTEEELAQANKVRLEAI